MPMPSARGPQIFSAGMGMVPLGQGQGWLDGWELGLMQGPERGPSVPEALPSLSGFRSPRGASSFAVCLLPPGAWAG